MGSARPAGRKDRQIRTGLADTPETSEFTAAYERIAARQRGGMASAGSYLGSAEEEVERETLATNTVGEAIGAPGEAAAVRPADDWLSPIPNADVPASAVEVPSPRRASQQGFLPLALDDYLALLDWTGRQARANKVGLVPADLKPILIAGRFSRARRNNSSTCGGFRRAARLDYSGALLYSVRPLNLGQTEQHPLLPQSFPPP